MKTLITSNERNAHRDTVSGDPAFTPFVAASVDELRYAEHLRERLRERFPNRPSPRVPHWAVGAD
jgi:hypothetical protein